MGNTVVERLVAAGLATPQRYSGNTSPSPGTAIWTPATGKRFWLLAYDIDVEGNVYTSGGGAASIEFTDGSGGTNIGVYRTPFLPSAAQTTGGDLATYTEDLTEVNGYLSSTIGNALYVFCSLAITNNIRVTVRGVEI